MGFDQKQPRCAACALAHKGKPFGFQPGGAQGAQHFHQLVGALAQHEPSAVPQGAAGALGHILGRAGHSVAGGGPHGVGALGACRKIRRVAGGKVVTPLLGSGGAKRPQVALHRGDMVNTVFRHSLHTQGAGVWVQFQRRAEAAVPGIVP